MMDALLGRCFARCAGDTGVFVTRSFSYCSAAAADSNPSNRSSSRRGDSSVQFLGLSLVNTTKLSSSVAGSAWSGPLGRSNHFRSPFLVNSSAASPVQVDGDSVNSNDFGTTDPSGTVRVRFLLQQECLFGQQFALVGDQPCMGLWDPSDAIPLEWSDGHIWKAELDLPVDQKIQFKFVLRNSSGEINWQPGPDRVLQTWEAENTIVVSEDWESADDKKITEESLDSPTEEAAMTIMEGISNSVDNINGQSLAILGASQGTKESVVDSEFPGNINCEGKLEGSNQEEDMILVPGLAPTSIAVAVQNISDASFGIGTEEEPNIHDFVPLSTKEERNETPSANLLEQNIELSQTSDDAVGNNMQWGRRKLEQLLLKLGFTSKSTETT